MKRIIALILAAVMVFALAGCAEKKTEKKQETDTVYSGKADKGIASDTPENVKNAIMKLRTDTAASKVGADGTLYGGDREFAWTVSDYLASKGYKHLGQWQDDVFVDLDDTTVVYRERGDREVLAVINYETPFVNYYSREGDTLHASSISADRCEVYDSNGTEVTGTEVTDIARGFTFTRETGAAFTWAVDENGYKYSTGTADYLISDTNVIGDDGKMQQLFYARTSGGGYEVRAACANMTGIVKLAEYDEHVAASDDNGEFDSTYIAVVGKKGELAWPDGKDPTTYESCSYVASTAGRGWINSPDEEISKLTMICLGQADLVTGMKDFLGLINSVGIEMEKPDIITYYAPEVFACGIKFVDGTSCDEMDAMVEAGLETEVSLG